MNIKEIVFEVIPGKSITSAAEFVITLQKANPKCKSIRFEFNSVCFDIQTKILDPNRIVQKYEEHLPRTVVI